MIDSPPSRGGNLLRECGTGASIAIAAVPGTIAAGIVVYEALAAGYGSLGFLAGLMATGLAGLAAALVRSPSPAVTAPSVLAALVQVSLVPAVVAQGGDPALALSAMVVSLLLCGVWQLLFGLLGLGEIVRYAPQPVVAGFGTGVAILALVWLAPLFFSSGAWAEPLFALTTGAVIAAAALWLPRLPTPLVGRLFAIVAYHLSLQVAPGLDLGPGLQRVELSDLRAFFPADLQSFAQLPNGLIWLVLGTSLTSAFVGILDTLMVSRIIRQMSEAVPTPRRELCRLGLANLVSALAGTVPQTSSAGLARIGHLSSARTPASRVIASLTLLLFLLAASRLLPLLPLIAFNTIILYFTLRVFNRALLQMFSDVARVERRGPAIRNLDVFCTVAGATVAYHPAIGVALGTLLSGVIFIRDMARPVIAARARGDRLWSRRGRSLADRKLLADRGGRTLIFRLQGVLFFGNADDLLMECRRIEGDIDTLILDLRRVTSIDVSGMAALRELNNRLESKGRVLLLAETPPQVAIFISATAFNLLPDLDAALEEGEDRILGRGASRPALLIEELEIFGALCPNHRTLLLQELSIEHHPPLGVLCRAGDAPTGVWILVAGSVSVLATMDGRKVRVGGVEAGAPVGELALVEHLPRSADVIADTAVTAAFLSLESFRSMKESDPEAANEITEWVARTTARRLRATSEALRFSEQ